MPERLQYPVLEISQVAVVVHPTSETFGIATMSAIRNGHFARAWLVDASGCAYTVARYDIVREVYWKRPKTPFGRGHRVKLMLADAGRPQIEEVKERVQRSMDQAPELWEGAAVDVTELKRRLSAASTLNMVFAIAGGFESSGS